MLAQLKSLIKFASLLTKLSTMITELSTFENENRYYMKYTLNGINYSKRINFEHFCEIRQANKLNELMLKQ